MATARHGGVRRWLAEAGDAIVSIFFPAGCRICDRTLVTASRVPICQECLSSFERLSANVCETCGRPLPGLAERDSQPLLCPACRDRTYAFDRARSFALYKDALVQAILLLKFEQIGPLGAWFADQLAGIVSNGGNSLAADIVVPVPLHRERER